jgi:hypothetical protein
MLPYTRVVRANRAEERLLSEVEADRVLDICVDQVVVGHAGAERVDAGERAARERLEQRRADVRELSALVGETVLVGAPVDDVDEDARAPDACDEPAAAHRQVGADRLVEGTLAQLVRLVKTPGRALGAAWPPWRAAGAPAR